jgi:hypothetical protein
MKNYKLIKYDKEALKELGFSESFPTIMGKKYQYEYPYGTIEFKIVKGKEHVCFYHLRFLLPCELKDEIEEKKEKSLLKAMKNDLKILKEKNIIK